jgi:hypothetical protein
MNMSKRNLNQVKLSISLSSRIIDILMNDGMTAPQIAQKIGKSRKFVYDVRNGKARLSAQDLGSLAGKVGKIVSGDTLEKIRQISKDDIKETAERVKGVASTLLDNLKNDVAAKGKELSVTAKKYYDQAVPGSKKAARVAVRSIGTFLQASGEFLQGVSGKKKS